LDRDLPIPYEKLNWFRSRLGLEGTGLSGLGPFVRLFLERDEEFSEAFYTYFYDIPETRILLKHERRPGHLKKAWRHWYKALFSQGLSNPFMAHIWHSGMRHVQLNIDQRFINLGYAVVRQFCHDLAHTHISVSEQGQVLTQIDRMIDFCLLVETQAYIAGTSHCDLEVVRGISHQVRNPLTVIGGNIVRLKRKAEPSSPEYKIFETILDENRRLEGMVIDVGVYSELFQKEPTYSNQSLKSAISSALEKMDQTGLHHSANIELQLSEELDGVLADPYDLGTLFYYVIQNRIEALDPIDPFVRISHSNPQPEGPFVAVEIFNRGAPLEAEEIEKAFIPFYSFKPQGTGFGLPIAQLAARKNLGDLRLEPVPDLGMRCIITLPAASP
jgi:signal transduction histidine kinase